MSNIKTIHKVGYNSQRDNFSFGGKFPGWKQCFSTSAHMFISYFSKFTRAESDDQLKWYVDQVEGSVGVRGKAEEFIKRFTWIPVNGSSYWWNIHEAMIAYVFGEHKVDRSVKFIDGGSWKMFNEFLERGPVVVGTMKMGGLPGGHIVLVTGVDYKKNQYILNDPYGNPLSNYREKNGESVAVPVDWFKIQCERAVGKGKVRFMGVAE